MTRFELGKHPYVDRDSCEFVLEYHEAANCWRIAAYYFKNNRAPLGYRYLFELDNGQVSSNKNEDIYYTLYNSDVVQKLLLLL